MTAGDLLAQHQNSARSLVTVEAWGQGKYVWPFSLTHILLVGAVP